MSAPRTNIPEQRRRHRFLLTGIAIAVGFAFTLLAIFIVFTVWSGNTPERIDQLGRTPAEGGTVGGAVATE
jgi:hypothetical protein